MTTSTISNKKTISILGCGWYGLELAKALIGQGHQVKGSTTTAEKLAILSAHQIQPFLVDIQKEQENFDPAFFQTELLFICMPPRRNTPEQADFICKIERIIAAAKQYKIRNIIFISSTAVYGDVNAELNELDVPKPETASGKSMLKVESLLREQSDFNTTVIRFSGLVGPGRHPGRFFAGKKDIPNGRAPINLIHLSDCIGISLTILKNELFGYTFNGCAPDHPSKQDFYTASAISANLTTPVFIDELLTWKIVGSVHTSVLNYNYLVTNWMKWLASDNLN